MSAVSTRTTALKLRTLVLNADYRPLALTPPARAAALCHAKRAFLIEPTTYALRAEKVKLMAPAVIVLASYRRTPNMRDPVGRLREHPVRLPKGSRTVVLNRDSRRCQYCGRSAHTVDHVLPYSRGGGNSWDNLVACCFSCNAKKGDKTPKEANMKLLRPPTKPSTSDATFQSFISKVPPCGRHYLRPIWSKFFNGGKDDMADGQAMESGVLEESSVCRGRSRSR